MSSSPAGKFQDHYTVLGVDPNADSETIQAAYAKLAEKYQPAKRVTGNLEQFDAVNLAFEVLSDPIARAEFDKLKGIGQGESAPQFSGAAFFEALGESALQRAALLCILYDRRRTNPFKPSISVRHLESMLQLTTEELNFALWYLKQRRLVINDDKSSLQITAEGMEYLEQNPPAADRVTKLLTAGSVQSSPEGGKKNADHAGERTSVLLALDRARTRRSGA